MCIVVSTLILSLIPHPIHFAGCFAGSGSTALSFLQEIVRKIREQYVTANIIFFILNGILIVLHGEIWIATENWNTVAYHCELYSNPR